MMTVHGGQFVIVTSYMGMWDDENEYLYYFESIDCEPDDCIYMFLSGRAFDDDLVDGAYPEMFSAVSDDIRFDE